MAKNITRNIHLHFVRHIEQDPATRDYTRSPYLYIDLEMPIPDGYLDHGTEWHAIGVLEMSDGKLASFSHVASTAEEALSSLIAGFGHDQFEQGVLTEIGKAKIENDRVRRERARKLTYEEQATGKSSE